ncbi:hypothetical protein GCM10018966_104300 [Streptomyces yanii]
MQIVLVVAGRIDVDHQVEVVHMQAPGGDIGGHESGDLTVLELCEGARALGLGLAAVQRGSADTARPQVLGQLVDRVFGVQEQEHPSVPGRDLGRDGVPVGAVDGQYMVFHRRDRSCRRVDRVDHRVVE